jgi:hypothetical protein
VKKKYFFEVGMANKTRKTTVFRRVYSPIKHAVMAGKESVSAVTNTAKYVTCDTLSGLDRIGSSVSRHANMAVNDLLGRRNRKSRRSRTRKGKKSGKYL